MSVTLNGEKIIPTIFPDKTQQVWKLDDELLECKRCDVEWIYEGDHELVTVCQLGDLLQHNANLYIPFLPYGRQDKPIANDTTFGLNTFLKIIAPFYNRVYTYDAHSKHLLPSNFVDIEPTSEIYDVLREVRPDFICYPDHGSLIRYEHCVPTGFHTVVLDKERDQLTGQITGLKISEQTYDLAGHSVLIIDDICDGGRTFIEAAKLLYSKDVASVYLYTSHGIYSKGLGVLEEAGIKRIFNRTGEVSLATVGA
jgi:ribose-phosphate pyrophosphokinase